MSSLSVLGFAVPTQSLFFTKEWRSSWNHLPCYLWYLQGLFSRRHSVKIVLVILMRHRSIITEMWIAGTSQREDCLYKSSNSLFLFTVRWCQKKKENKKNPPYAYSAFLCNHEMIFKYKFSSSNWILKLSARTVPFKLVTHSLKGTTAQIILLETDSATSLWW